MTRITVLHPGAMGVTVAASFVEAGHDVRWVSEGRSPATIARAEEAGLIAVPSLADGCARAELVVSVCPPSAAVDLARSVGACGFSGVYLDANAISPATCTTIAGDLRTAGVSVVDGSIIGPPARRPGTTRLYLAGPEAGALADDLSGGALEVGAIDGGLGAASALKMAYAGWTKGSSALLLAVAAYATGMGVQDALLAEWARSLPGLAEDLEARAASVGPKAWRFAGEMEEIAASMQAAGLDDGFHRAAAEIYGSLAEFKDAEQTASLDAVLAAMLRRD